MTYNLKFDPSEEKKRIKWKGVFQKSIKWKGTYENSINCNILGKQFNFSNEQVHVWSIFGTWIFTQSIGTWKNRITVAVRDVERI